MKSNPFDGFFRKKLFFSLITLGFCLTNVSPSNSSDSVPDLNQDLLQMDLPAIPKLKNEGAYLYYADEKPNVKLVLQLASKRVQVYEDDQVIATFPVAVGKKGWETPQGEFKIIQMIENPSWQNPWTGKVIPPNPNGPLGERWIGFWSDGKNFIGFHGTPGENLIGQAVSHGCVRMKNKDVKQLFSLVSLGIPVTVVNK
ncbi:MAG: L,D-transpeptidase [Cyanobacteria bacterium]|nr:L,D-transpeptidase [Cyanobacteria bacterium CG_2015-16_32_12]NCO78787.1 L,D-transpeptidase [Cyanobacteria bacterium CG_2015-22_32_23]NCQ42101.1 L,D-transpeptidase [Cyanobacteria bacterium CG_2015-04_32_10]NCS86094.1 L,D-transpeptidase [Cyanobacteria bacterium CG_2015-02_32_10]